MASCRPTCPGFFIMPHAPPSFYEGKALRSTSLQGLLVTNSLPNRHLSAQKGHALHFARFAVHEDCKHHAPQPLGSAILRRARLVLVAPPQTPRKLLAFRLVMHSRMAARCYVAGAYAAEVDLCVYPFFLVDSACLLQDSEPSWQRRWRTWRVASRHDWP